MSMFVHLKLHTEYSVSDGLIRCDSLIKRTIDLGMPAIAVTDKGNLFCAVKFYKQALEAGVKPLLGSDLLLHDPSEEESDSVFTVLVKDLTGYRNLIKLISLGYTEGQKLGLPTVTRILLEKYSNGLIVLSGGMSGDLGLALISKKHALAEKKLSWWMKAFPDSFYIELNRTGKLGESNYIKLAVEIAQNSDCPVVGTNDVRFLDVTDFEAHEARVCIGEGRALDDPRRVRRYTEQQYLRSMDDMVELFADIPEAIENTVQIAKRCNLILSLGKPYLPDYPVPKDTTVDDHLHQLAIQGLDRHLSENPCKEKERYVKRLKFELDTITNMGFSGYFLIVMDFIKWAKEQKIPVGPGRGSGAGSLVAYALSITDLDPIEYDLLFERFLNPERISMPDFDVDFCMDQRDRVIEYVTSTYGREAVSQIITFGSMAAKAVVRDVARVQGKPYLLADKLSKLIPFEVGMTLNKAAEQEKELSDFLKKDAEAEEIWEMALQLEGIKRNVGRHAGGVVISPSKLTDYTPLYCDDNGESLVTQYDMHDVEDVGLVKFDFLGLRTLTIINWSIQTINNVRGSNGENFLDLHHLPLDDPRTFETLQSGETTAIFQLESRGMKELIARLRPDCFEDIIALVALFRPGPLQSGMVDNFINRKHGKEEISYPDPKYQHVNLKSLLEPTYGVILYQEQVMQIAQVLAGYSLGEADVLRRAMGKKKKEEMAEQRAVFEEGAKKQGVEVKLAIKIFDLVEKFAGYGFNKSHSAAYALLSYQTAWLKTHYPGPFMAAVMSSEMDDTDKLENLRVECNRMNVVINLPPDVNLAEYRFTVNSLGEIIWGLGAIKGLGEGPVKNIVNARKSGGDFSDLYDFCLRTDSRLVNRRAIEALINSGAMDVFGVPPWILMSSLDDTMRMAAQNADNIESGINDLFSTGESPIGKGAEEIFLRYRGCAVWTDRERRLRECETLGFYISGHPYEEYEDEIKNLAVTPIKNLRADASKNQTCSGVIVSLRVMRTKRGNLAIFLIDDRSARIEVTADSENFEKQRQLLTKNQVVVISGKVAHDDYSGKLAIRAKDIQSVSDRRRKIASGLTIMLTAEMIQSGIVDKLEEALSGPYTGDLPVSIVYRGGASAKFQCGERWSVSPTDELLRSLKDCVGEDAVALEYSSGI